MPDETNGDTSPTDEPASSDRPSTWREMRTSEDWWAIWIGGLILLIAFLAVYVSLPIDFSQQIARAASNGEKFELSSPLKPWLAKPGKWLEDPVEAFYQADELNVLPGLAGVFGLSLLFFGLGLTVMGQSFVRFAIGFCFVFFLATLAYALAGQEVIKHYSLSYALWALLVGLIISNTIGTPQWVKPGVRTEFYIKTGLVVMGAEVLFSLLLALGVPGICVAWIVTPVVLVSTYIFGQKVLKIQSKSLNMVISADMSVCGVSAAIATAAACRAKKEELSLAIGLSLLFTVVMMVVMPAAIKALGMGEVLGGAWMGGTIDSTGAVTAAGDILGETARIVAVTIKIIQNVLIGVTAFGVSIYWVTRVEPAESHHKPNAMEIWYRFPKFVIGFLLASAVFSILYVSLPGGDAIVTAVTKQSTRVLRGWFFCLAFVSIGLDTDFRRLAAYLKGGKPLLLYVAGQSLNLILTLFMSWLMFEVVFKDAVAELAH